MTTAFALTGIQRCRLQHYRPSYYSDLAPIYEDTPIHQLPDRRHSDYGRMTSFEGIANSIDIICAKNDSFHDYAKIDISKMDKVEVPGTLANPSKTSAAMLDGLMTSRFKKKGNVRKNSSEKLPKQGNNKDNGGFHSNRCDINIHKNPSDCDKMASETSKIEVTDAGHKDQTAGEDIAPERSSSLYQAHPRFPGDTGGTTVNYTLVENDRGVALKRWPKLDPEPPKDSYLWCPAERKMRQRCFVFCFVALVALICVFVVAMIDGWLIKETGKGISGTDEPAIVPTLIRTTFTFGNVTNATDIEDFSNMFDGEQTVP